ncbi:MAG TPA: anthranilate phosphoribosyltransferase [Terriglobia bacterium]|nr:anthranilate phosphoribosyltransferase [Terriglobia bacterium]
MHIREAIDKLKSGQNLERGEARAVMQGLLSGSVPDNEIIEFLVALRDKGETTAELVGFAEIMRAKAAEGLHEAGVDINELAEGEPLLDTCGTGGDGRGTFNVSTAAALVAAAAGVRVAKHGNRSISSRCGSADVLEALGVRIDLPLERIDQCLAEVGMVFLFAPRLHLAMKHVMNARRSLQTKTVFNLLGPLTNPLRASVQLVGVYDPARTEMMARALGEVGTRRAFVVCGSDGIDEITTTSSTRLSECCNSSVQTREVVPEDFGLSRTTCPSLQGGNAETNARMLRRILEGDTGPQRDVVLANASAALVVAGNSPNFQEGVERAREAIDSGRALRKLEALIAFTQASAP